MRYVFLNSTQVVWPPEATCSRRLLVGDKRLSLATIVEWGNANIDRDSAHARAAADHQPVLCPAGRSKMPAGLVPCDVA